MEVKTRKILKVILLFSLVLPLSAQAALFDDFVSGIEDWVSEQTGSQTNSSGNVQIKNEVKVEASTGGNSVGSGGEIKQGEQKTEIEIKNIINGQEIEPVNINSSSSKAKVEIKIEANDGKIEVEREIEVDSEKSEQNYQINADNQNSQDDASSQESAGAGTDSGVETEKENILEKTATTTSDFFSAIFESIKSFFENIFSIF
ncbi:MAG: hypothetical protein HY764_03525 [Candidatus Portnoybacteria bacterium]|nr:hypothetical protein [Candidatus Portnoybacteria bacterium]